jgi:solute carrier family 8 (sodium/calcium exchanger)
MQTTSIDKVNIDDLKKAVEGDQMISRIKYRKQVGKMLSGARQAIAKGQIMKEEHAHAKNIAESEKNPNFGFTCLHYSVSEASGHLKIEINNKKGAAGRVRVLTVDAEAIAGDDYEKVDEILEFAAGQKTRHIEVKINDDDNWEPDEDFFVHLLDPNTGAELPGKDCKTRVTIIDDDKPGQLCFEETKVIKAVAPEKDQKESQVDVVILRKNGSDGEVTVKYETVQLDRTDNTATEGVDYDRAEGTLVFKQGETRGIIKVTIKARPDADMRDDSFGIQLSNITPDGAKLSKKSFMIINIVTDVEEKKKQEALQQLLDKITDEEEMTWGKQFIKACECHPTKNEDGEIEDITFSEGFLHFVTIGWKIFYAIIPPPHMGEGWPCFVISLVMIGITTYVVGEVANLFGCVLGIPPSVTAITFVALGTSLPDTFASMSAAVAEKYADDAVGNVTGSNSVNVFLGLGLPWVIASVWEGSV